VPVASIFVNRLQFLPHEDFDSYPRTCDDDCELLSAPAATCCSRRTNRAVPAAAELQGAAAAALADILEGHFRPGFFTGVCTVVMKLFAACSRASRCSARRTTSS
jgi:pantoate--beta-alanine ligase